MTTASQTWTEETVQLAGASVQLVRGGTGSPLLVLHDEMGHPGPLRYQEALARGHALLIPSHPGYGTSERLDWIMTMRDLAGWYLHALDDLGVGEVDLLGGSLGGWLAAEMAAMEPRRFKKLVLVAPMGIRPPTGEIFDMFLVTAQPYIAAGFFNPEAVPEYQELYGSDPTPEQRELLEVAREQSCRLGWRPYMHDPALPHLLRRVKQPTLIVWGRQDAIVPLSAGEVYRDAIAGSRLVVLDDCGHRPEIEQADTFVRLVEEFLRGGQ
jgi:pimeloyl-ACP methyl ester carboxylesterase